MHIHRRLLFPVKLSYFFVPAFKSPCLWWDLPTTLKWLIRRKRGGAFPLSTTFMTWDFFKVKIHVLWSQECFNPPFIQFSLWITHPSENFFGYACFFSNLENDSNVDRSIDALWILRHCSRISKHQTNCTSFDLVAPTLNEILYKINIESAFHAVSDTLKAVRCSYRSINFFIEEKEHL